MNHILNFDHDLVRFHKEQSTVSIQSVFCIHRSWVPGPLIAITSRDVWVSSVKRVLLA